MDERQKMLVPGLMGPELADNANPVEWAIKRLRSLGHRVEFENIPGLYRVNGGPELTTRQLIEVASKQSGCPPYTPHTAIMKGNGHGRRA